MNYTKPKEQLLSEIRVRAFSAISRNMGSLESVPMNSMGYMIQNAIAEGIQEAFRTLIEHTYTDQQFEEDIKLKT